MLFVDMTGIACTATTRQYQISDDWAFASAEFWEVGRGFMLNQNLGYGVNRALSCMQSCKLCNIARYSAPGTSMRNVTQISEHLYAVSGFYSLPGLPLQWARNGIVTIGWYLSSQIVTGRFLPILVRLSWLWLVILVALFIVRQCIQPCPFYRLSCAHNCAHFDQAGERWFKFTVLIGKP